MTGDKMKTRFPKILYVALFLLIAAGVRADLVVGSKTDIELAGMGKMAMSGEQCFRPDRSYTRMTTTGISGMSAESVEIIRLDKEVQWVVFPAQTKYAEIPFAEIKEIAAALDTIKPQSGGYTWATSFTKLDSSMTVAGIACRGFAGKAVGVKADDPTDTSIIEFKQFFASDFDGEKELKAFRDAYKTATGLDDRFFSQIQENPMLQQYGEPLRQLAEKVDIQAGTPLKTSFVIKVSKDPMGVSGTKKLGGNVLLKIENEITSIKHNTIEDSLFEVPASYTKSELGPAMGM